MTRPINDSNSATAVAPSGEVDREALQGLWHVLLGVLEERGPLLPVPEFAATHLAPHAERLPLTMTGRCAGDPVFDWISAAAVVESQGFLEEAWEMLNALEQRLDDDTLVRSEAEREEIVAFLCTRRGRISRTSGHLDDAERWYREAMRRSARLPREVRWIDALPNALLGLAILQVGRGNYPEAQRTVLRVLAPSSLSPDFHRVQAFMLLTLILRKRGRHAEALASIWKAQDLLPSHDPRHADVLTVVAEVAVELGATVPALRARLAVLAFSSSPRLAVASLAGTLSLLSGAPDPVRRQCEAEIARSAWGRHVLSQRSEATVSERLLSATMAWVADPPARGLTPYDVVMLSLAITRLALELGRLDVATDAVNEAHALSVARGFHEWVFQAETLRASIADAASARATARASEAAAARSRQSVRTASGETAAGSGAAPQVTVVRGAALRRLLAFEHQQRLDGRAVFL